MFLHHSNQPDSRPFHYQSYEETTASEVASICCLIFSYVNRLTAALTNFRALILKHTSARMIILIHILTHGEHKKEGMNINGQNCFLVHFIPINFNYFQFVGILYLTTVINKINGMTCIYHWTIWHGKCCRGKLT